MRGGDGLGGLWIRGTAGRPLGPLSAVLTGCRVRMAPGVCVCVCGGEFPRTRCPNLGHRLCGRAHTHFCAVPQWRGGPQGFGPRVQLRRCAPEGGWSERHLGVSVGAVPQLGIVRHVRHPVVPAQYGGTTTTTYWAPQAQPWGGRPAFGPCLWTLPKMRRIQTQTVSNPLPGIEPDRGAVWHGGLRRPKGAHRTSRRRQTPGS
jgi:hypothetical protein